MSALEEKYPRVNGIASSIRVVPNLPKPGAPSSTHEFSVLSRIEARGFFFGPPIALAVGAKFVPLRKPRKLPGPVISEEYVLEHGRDCLEMHIGAVEHSDRTLVVDDLIATGGTLCAAMNLGHERLNGKPLHILIESR